MPVIPRFLMILTAAVLVVVSTSCGVDQQRPVVQRRADRILHQWHDDGGAGKVTIQISLTDQIAEFKRGGRNIGWCYVATGKEGHDTRPGTYKITEKIADKYSNIYGWHEDEFGNVTDPDAKAREKVPPGMIYVPAPMPYWMRLTSYGVGMHGGIIPEPGEPASHGCIRMPKDFVPILFDAVEVGTPVVITNAPSRNGPASPASPVVPAMQEDWNPSRAIGGGDGSVQSVRYRDGMPVSYE
jgi:L,D-transpeptidase catalytic domain